MPHTTKHFGALETRKGKRELSFVKTLLYNPALSRFGHQFVPLGFKLLDKWEVAVPVADQVQLAKDIGNEEERQYSKHVIRDLRVPYYDVRLIFMRRCPMAQRLLDAWLEEERRGGNTYLAFLRALYTVKPIICALPVTWVGKRVD